MILSVCMSPCTDVTIELDSLNVGKTNVVKNKTVGFGGKALNVAIGVARLGGDPFATGVMYADNAGMFENALNKEGVPFRFIHNCGRARENYKFIDSRAMLTEVNDIGTEVEENTLTEVLRLVKELSTKSRVVVLSGGLPRSVSGDYYGKLAESVDEKCLKIIDASGERLRSALKTGADLIKPNLEELENTIGRCIQDKEDMLAACYELIDCGAKRVLLSLGKEGAILTDGMRNYHCKSINVAVNSTVGAGDGMVAAAAMKLQEGAPLSEILRAGVAAGTATVMTTGQVSFSYEKYLEVLSNLRVTEF